MALGRAYWDESTGASCPNAYHRITSLTLNPTGPGAQLQVGIYCDAAARQENRQPVATASYGIAEPDYSERFGAAALEAAGTNPVKQAYAWLKEQPEYESAVNC